MQLAKYAKLIEKQDFGCREIVYITRDFEIPPPDAPAGVIPRRWFQFYNHLKAHTNGDGLAEQLKLFMEENKMTVRNQFTSIDSLALGNFLGAKALMDETLWSGVDKKFEKVLGKVSSPAKCLSELRKYDRYVMYVEIGGAKDFECLLGYWLPNKDPGEPPWLGIKLGSNPNSGIRKNVITAFRDFAKKNAGWQDSDLDNDREWASIRKGALLTTFMGESDHLKAIRDYFSALLDEVMQFRSVNPKLPWSTRSTDAEDE